MAAYSATTDLLTGDIPLPSYITPAKYVTDAADEIDSYIGFIYLTPINVTDVPENLVSRPARLLLKRISTHLSSGRLLMAVAAPQEENNTHAYGARLVREALTALNAIADGTISLEGAAKNITETVEVTAPLINNLDAVSAVETFYDRARNPLSYESFVPRAW